MCIFPQLVLKDISAQTVQGNVHLTVNLTHVNMRMDHVLVLQVGWVIIVLQVMLFKRKYTLLFSKIALLNKFLNEISLKICHENYLIIPEQLYCPHGHRTIYRRKVKLPSQNCYIIIYHFGIKIQANILVCHPQSNIILLLIVIDVIFWVIYEWR